MSDLISRSELINALKVHFDSCFREDGELLYSDHICTSDDVVDLIKLVENQPTAYNVDKVVEELEKLKNNNPFVYGKNDKSRDASVSRQTLDYAIEIVKQGGVSDDVCEWKQDNMCETVYRVCGGFSTTAYQTDFEFCPYCGKKIKVKQNDN